MPELSLVELEEKREEGVTEDQSGAKLPDTPSMTACGSKDYTSRFGLEISGSDQVPNVGLSESSGGGRQVKTFGMVVKLGQMSGHVSRLEEVILVMWKGIPWWVKIRSKWSCFPMDHSLTFV